MIQSGIYCIRNLENQHIYIGGSNSIRRRFREHKYTLQAQTHKNDYLQRAWNKYGEDAFEFTPLLLCPISQIDYLEQLLIDKLNPDYNISFCVEASRRGISPTKETRQKLSAAHKGKTLSLGHKYKLSLAHQGKKFSKEHRLSISRALAGRTRSEEHNSKFYGEKNSQSKLTEADVQIIKQRLADGDTHRNIAKDYGVCHSVVGRILNKQAWAWLE